MKNEISGFLLKWAAFTALLFAVHYYIFFNFFSEIELYFPLWTIYAFNAILVLIVYSIIRYRVRQGLEKVYNLFLILTLVKMALAVVFLLPLFTGKSEQPRMEVINFFIPYFLFLAFEIFALNKFFKNDETK